MAQIAKMMGQYLSETSQKLFLAGFFMIILLDIQGTQGLPLVFKNTFSFQKTTPSTTTEVPLHDHDHDEGISYLGKGFGTNSDSNSSTSFAKGFRYAIVACVVAVVALIYLLYLKFKKPKPRKPNGNQGGTRYVFPVVPSSSTTGKSTDDSAPICNS